jgi:HEAT repeat protein
VSTEPTPHGTQAAATTFDDWDEPPLPAAELHDLFQALDKAARAQRLYADNNPVYQGFQSNLRAAFAKLWDRVSSLPVTVEEHAFGCFDQTFAAAEGRDDLPFLFYKDGIRVLTFLPGFEEESERFLNVINRARQLDHRSIDDMVTLLWEQEFSAFQYSYVDMLAEGLAVPQAGEPAVEYVDAGMLRDAVEGRVDEMFAPAVAAGEPPVALAVQPENFVETAYFLEPHELEALQREVELEWQRDTKAAVLDALFDRLEDRRLDWQQEILRVLRQLMPVYLSGGDLASASHILTELSGMIEKGVFQESELAEVQDLFNELSEPKVLAQLLASLSDGSIRPAATDLQVFLTHLSAGALPLLIHAAEGTEEPALKELLRVSIEGLAQEHRDVLVGLIGSEDLSVVLGAARLAGQLGLGSAAGRIATLLSRPEAPARRVAVEALVRIRSGQALAAVQGAIEDDDREVRITAVRGLAAVRYQPARQRLEEAIQSKRLGETDLTEQIAFFEAYGSVASPESVKLLDRLLNGRKLLGKQSPEMRACAAMALGRVQAPAAKASLQQAAQDPNPIVRNAVARALAGEAAAR